MVKMICRALNINIDNNFCLRDSENNVFKLREGLNAIGKNEGKNSLYILNAGISAKHAIINIKKDELPEIIDLSTTAGTYVNGKRIDPTTTAILNPGDEICFGQTKYVFDVFEDE